MKQNTIWIAIIDSHHAKIFEAPKNENLVLIKEMILETEPNPKQGRSFDSFGEGRHAIEPHTEFKNVERQHFASQIDEFLEESLKQNKFDNLILVCPHKMAEFLNEKLSAKIKEKIVHKLHKNISEFNPTEIKEYLHKQNYKF